MKDAIASYDEGQEFSYELKIPKDRVAVLIGTSGETKKQIEEETRTKIKVDSKEGDIFVTGKDSIMLYTVKEIIRAIARGFNPDIATLLLKPDYAFELISISDFAKTHASQVRLKGRVIGAKGKSRKHIEDLTDSHISVYGKTIGIIAHAERIALCRKAIESLLRGSPHSNVYKWLEKQRKEQRTQDFKEEENGKSDSA